MIYSGFAPEVRDVNGNLLSNGNPRANKRMILNRHGIRVIFVTSGNIGLYSFTALVLEIVSATVLMSIANLIIDNVAFVIIGDWKENGKAQIVRAMLVRYRLKFQLISLKGVPLLGSDRNPITTGLELYVWQRTRQS